MITLLFFAGVADRIKARRMEVPLSATPQSVVEGDTILSFLNDRVARVAVNREWAQWDTSLADGDEVAFMPPPRIH
ncbi:MAG: MoaD/ThiS family protein [Elusimicrobia bacterium]|jgi:molybdopterin converting factor small subunit|nr:MoaD/ThiS family protein [Elusimicrobiota bacterium]